MSLTTRRRCLLLLLLVLASQLSLTVHAANHLSPDTASCQLCTGYHNGGLALTAAVVPVPEIFSIPSYHSNVSIPLTEATPLPYRQRAPPFSV